MADPLPLPLRLVFGKVETVALDQFGRQPSSALAHAELRPLLLRYLLRLDAGIADGHGLLDAAKVAKEILSGEIFHYRSPPRPDPEKPLLFLAIIGELAEVGV